MKPAVADLPTSPALSDLEKAPGYWYLASSYSKYPRGLDEAFKVACRYAEWLIRNGVTNIYCPIAHSHSIALLSGLDARDHDVWMAVNQPMMSAAHGLLVCDMEGWQESEGIYEEIFYFTHAGKPAYLLELGLENESRKRHGKRKGAERWDGEMDPLLNP